MFKNFLLALCCAACVSAPCPQKQPSTSADGASDSDEVYAAVINWRNAHPGEGQTGTQLVFLDTTTAQSCFAAKKEDCPKEVQERLKEILGQDFDVSLVNDFLEQNKIRGPLSRSIPTDLPKSWLSETDETALFSNKKHDGWQVFYAKYPGASGILGFSRVGFNQKHDRALFYSQISCGWLCGTGHYHLLKKESGKWTLVTNSMLWIS